MLQLPHEQLTVGKILDRSFNFIFKNIFWITIIAFLINLPVFYDVLSNLENILAPESLSIFGIVKETLIVYVIALLTHPFLKGTVIILFSHQSRGEQINWWQSLKKCMAKIVPIILLEVLISLAVVFGSILLIIPGLIVMCATACAVPAMLLEDLGPMEAFDRSWNLTKGHRWRIFGYLTIDRLIAEAIRRAVPLVVADPFYAVGLSTLIAAPLDALWPVLSSLLYYDLRSRKEALDLEEEANAIPATVMEPA